MKRKDKVLWAIVILWTLFIFSNSLTIGQVSGARSGRITHLLLDLVNRTGFTIDYDLFHHYIRKTAHFTEYAVLGMFVTEAISSSSPLHNNLLFLLFMAGVPALDETIQLFVPDRCGALKDCMIDMSGYLAGAFFMYILILIARDLRIKLSNRK